MTNWTISPTLSTPSDCASTVIRDLMPPDIAPEPSAVIRFEVAMAKPLAENAALQAALESIIDNFETLQPTAAAQDGIVSAAPDMGSSHAERRSYDEVGRRDAGEVCQDGSENVDISAQPQNVAPGPALFKSRVDVPQFRGPIVAASKPVVESMPIRAEAEPLVVDARRTSFGEHEPALAEAATMAVKARQPSNVETRSAVAAEKPIAAAEKAPVATERPTAVVRPSVVIIGSPTIADKPVAAAVDAPMAAAEKPSVAVDAQAAVAKPVAAAVDAPTIADKPVAAVDAPMAAVEKPSVAVDAQAAVAKPVAAAVDAPTIADKPVAAVDAPMAMAEKPSVAVDAQATVAKPVAAVVDAPTIADKSVVAVDAPMAAAEKPSAAVDAQTVAEKPVVAVSQAPRATEKSAAPLEPHVPLAPSEKRFSAVGDESQVSLNPLQAAPMAVAAPSPEIQPAVVPEPVAQVSSAVLAKVEAATAAEILVEAVTAVSDAMTVSPGLMHGDGEVRIQLKPDVLAGTELKIAVSGVDMRIEFTPTLERVASLLAENQAGLVQHLAERVGNFNFAVAVNRKNLRAAVVGSRSKREEVT